MRQDVLINVDVPNLDEGVAFYGQAFGLIVTRRLGAEVVELSGLPVAAGAKPETEIRVNSWGKIAVLSDTFGHGASVSQRMAFECVQWVRRGGALPETPIRSPH